MCHLSFNRFAVAPADSINTLYRDTPEESRVPVDVTIRFSWTLWKIKFKDLMIPSDQSDMDSTEIGPFVAAYGDVSTANMAIGPDLKAMVVWLGPHIWFYRTDKSNLYRMKGELPAISGLDPSEPKAKCLDTRFSTSMPYCVTAWNDGSSSTGSTPREVNNLAFYRFDGDAVHLHSNLSIRCKPRWYAFHPEQPLLLVTTGSSLFFYDFEQPGTPVLKREVAAATFGGPMRVTLPKTDEGRSSPPSTREGGFVATKSGMSGIPPHSFYFCRSLRSQRAKLIRTFAQDGAPMYFSKCGKYIYHTEWDRFASLGDLLNLDNEPNASRILSMFKGEVEKMGDPWSTISPSRPTILYEDVLYAAGQQRFKIFRIWSYIVLGWAADGNSFFRPPPYESEPPAADATAKGADEPSSATTAAAPGPPSATVPMSPGDQPAASASDFTWYRRVLCAIPKNFASWTATLCWPKNDRHRLAIVMFPVSSTDLALPKVIFCPVTPADLNPKPKGVKLVDKRWERQDGWIMSKASGCAYHLRAD